MTIGKLILKWVKCEGDIWCPLLTVDPSSIDKSAAGVYIIWEASKSQAAVVRVGQGTFRDRFSAHRNDKEILAQEKLGTLYVTWAGVPSDSRDGVERYLHDTFKPLVGPNAPMAEPIVVNLPWR